MKILVADDNPVLHNVLKAMLTNWGYEVVVASNGIEAWRQLQAEDGPRLAILDWRMPGMDGVEICRRVRSEGHLNYVYLLLLTPNTSSEDLAWAMEAGADDYVAKPFKSAELRARVRAGCRILKLREQLMFACQTLLVSSAIDPLLSAPLSTLQQFPFRQSAGVPE